MKTNTAFESKMREANYASLDAFRSALRQHPLIADYVCDLLVARGVVEVRDDGSVVGLAGSGGVATGARRGSRAAEPSAEKGEWKPHWPDRGELIEAMRPDDEHSCYRFSEIQETLQVSGEPHSHWIVLHGLWSLIKEGVVEKKGKGYVLTDAAESRHPSSYNVITMALKKAGPPYLVADVDKAIRSIPGHNFYGKHTAYTADDPLLQKDVDGWVKARKGDGLL
jgi:hypothetical protein